MSLMATDTAEQHLQESLEPNPRRGFAAKTRSTISAYLLSAPGLALLALFVIWPIFSGLWTSFHSFDGVNPMQWIGIKNYKNVLTDPLFLSSIGHTLYFALIVVLGKNIFGFLIALFLNRRFVGQKSVRTLLFMPIALNVLVIGSFWTFFLGKEEGLLNQILERIGLESLAQAWLSDPTFALTSVAIVEIWRWLPLHVLIYLAGLQELPVETREAALLDGAGPLRSTWSVVLPMLKPVIFVNVIISLTGAFVRSFELVWVLTKGTAGTNIVLTSMYTEAFQYGRFGSAAAMGFVLFLITAAISTVSVWSSKGGNNE